MAVWLCLDTWWPAKATRANSMCYAESLSKVPEIKRREGPREISGEILVILSAFLFYLAVPH